MRQPHHPAIDQIDLTDVLAALSDKVRLSILATLADGQPRTCGAFDQPVAKSTFSHHLKVLREAGLITSRVEGNRCYVALRPELAERFPGLLQNVLDLAAGPGADVA